jgi:hypothetical protein
MATAPHSSPLAPAPAARIACAGAALAVTGILTASLLGLFHQASPSRWLAPTPELMELAATCQALPGRGDRLHCTRTIVAAYRERLGRELLLADGR